MDKITTADRPTGNVTRLLPLRDRLEEHRALSEPDGVTFEEQDVGPERPLPDGRARLEESVQASEQIRVLRAHLHHQGLHRHLRCIGVVSAAAGEGKTTVALGLARALAREPDTRVVLIEADLRRPSLDFCVGAEIAPEGLLQYLEGTGGTVVLRHLVRERLHFLSAGQRASNRADLLTTPRMTALVEAARKTFDYVIVDCPPLSQVADSMMLRDLLDGFVFVVRSRHTPREAVQRAIDVLTPARMCGVVFNAHREILSGREGHASRRHRVGE